MTSVDDLWYLSDAADHRAERAYHRLTDQYDEFRPCLDAREAEAQGRSN